MSPPLAARRALVVLLLISGGLFAFRHARRAAGFWSIDDAAVTYAAAFELADHRSFAPSFEGTPVESYSNPLVFFVVAALRLAGWFDPITTHLHVEAFLFGCMLALVWSTLRTRLGDLPSLCAALIFAALELITPATWLWYGSGLENIWVSVGLLSLLWLCEKTQRGVPLSPAWGLAALAVAMTRPEAPVYVAAFFLALALFARPATLAPRAHLRQIARMLLVTGGGAAVWLGFRRMAYGDWLPNTYYAKLPGGPALGRHSLDYVVDQLLPYCGSALFSCAAPALWLAPATRRLAPAYCLLLAAALTLPLVAGGDWMGEHRFATPFLMMSHAAYSALAAACLAGFPRSVRALPRASALVALLGALVVFAGPGVLRSARLAIRDPITLPDVTIARVAELQGAARWEHQARLGLPNAVVLLPDAGGSLLAGAMQLVDNGYLADYQLPRIARGPDGMRQVNQYEIAERRPDLVDPNPAWPFDRRNIGARYLAGGGALLARRELIDLREEDPTARLVYQSGGLRLSLSPQTVPTVAPGGLVRCEVIVAWRGGPPDARTRLAARVEGDRDSISLAPYEAKADGRERRALLVRAPETPGSFAVSIEVIRDGETVFRGPLLILEVTREEQSLERAAAAILQDTAPAAAMRRMARLREQLVPRLGMLAFRGLRESLALSHATNDPSAGRQLAQLRWHQRLAHFEPLPLAIRRAEAGAIHNFLATCPPAPGAPAGRVLCLGHAVDELRRQGYFGVTSIEPGLAEELDRARHALDSLGPLERYRALVGLTLAIPSSLPLQRALLEARRLLSDSPEL